MTELRTLVVDDDADQRRVVRTLLERAGVGPVVEAADAAQALAIVADQVPDLVLLDVAMPGRSGLEVLPELLELAPDARVVVLSNFPRRRLGALALARGAVGYVEKRTPPDRLVGEVLIAAAISEAAAERVSRDLPAEPTSPGAARALVRQLLGQEQITLVESVELLVSELVTNAIVHAHSAPRVEVALTREVIRVTVHDDDPTLPSARVPDLDRPGGRGLHLVGSLASRWGASPSDGGKVVWFELLRPTG